jgi:Na+/melibiose symporter-like transporter
MLCRVLVLVFVGRLLRRDLEAYRVVFPLAGLCMLVGALLFRSIPGSRGDRRARRAPQSRSLRGHALDAVRAALDNKALLVFLIGYSLATCGGVLHGNALPLFAKDEIGLNTAQWGYAIAASLVVTLATFWFWGAFMDRFSAPLTMVICWAALAALTAAVFFVESWPALLAIMTARGLFFSGNLLAFFPIVMHFTRSSETTRGMALHSSLWGIRWVMMPLVVVFVVDGALFPTRYLFLVSFCLIAVGATTMARVWWLGRKESGDAGSLS